MKKKFVVLTPNQKFEQADSDIIFIGEQCNVFDNIKDVGSYLILPSVMEEREVFIQASVSVESLYVRFFDGLCKVMNEIHGTQYTKRYWQIILGPWLIFFLERVYERFYSIVELSKRHAFSAVLSHPDKYVILDDVVDFNTKCAEDDYNLQIYSKIIRFLFGRRAVNDFFSPALKAKTMGGACDVLLQRNSTNVVIRSDYFPAVVESIFAQRCLGALNWVDNIREIRLSCDSYDLDKRNRLGVAINPQNLFEEFVCKIIPSEIPTVYIENYNKMSQYSFVNYQIIPGVIFSSSSWHLDEAFKIWAAYCSEMGTKLVGVQHGANYGMNIGHMLELHEKQILDRWYNWGWEDNDVSRPMPNNKFCGRMSYSNDGCEKNERVLYITTLNSRYYVWAGITSFQRYFEWQYFFLTKIESAILEKTHVRMYVRDYGIKYEEYYNKYLPNVKLERWDIPFSASLKTAKIVICDYLGTTFLECIALNKPVILIRSKIEPGFFLNKDVEEMLDKLKKVEVVFDSPIKAAKCINEVYQSISTWWYEEERQRYIKEFCNKYALQKEDGINIWIKEINSFFKMEVCLKRIQQYINDNPEKKVCILGMRLMSAWLLNRRILPFNRLAFYERDKEKIHPYFKGCSFTTELCALKDENIGYYINTFDNEYDETIGELEKILGKNVKWFHAQKELPSSLISEYLIDIKGEKISYRPW